MNSKKIGYLAIALGFMLSSLSVIGNAADTGGLDIGKFNFTGFGIIVFFGIILITRKSNKN